MEFANKNIKISVLGKPVNWKLNSSFVNIAGILQEHNVQNLYVPDPSDFTGQISSSNDFVKSSKLQNDISIMNGISTEGLILPKNSASLIATGDCPTIVVYNHDTKEILTAHAGLGSIIDKNYVYHNEKSRKNESVVDRICEKFFGYNCQIMILCGISYQSFIYSISDPNYSEINKKMLDYIIKKYGEHSIPCGIEHGGISIHTIIKTQFEKNNFDPNSIICDGIDTYTDESYWSHSRFVKKQETGMNGRNGILTINKSS